MRLLTFTILLFTLGCNTPTTSAQPDKGKNIGNTEFKNKMDSFTIVISKDSTNGKLFFERAFYYMRNVPSIPFDSVIDKTNEQISQLKKDKDMLAINDYLKAISLGFKKKLAYLNLGVIYTFHDDNIALDYFNKSLNEDPDFEKAKYEIELCRKRIEMNHYFY